MFNQFKCESGKRFEFVSLSGDTYKPVLVTDDTKLAYLMLNDGHWNQIGATHVRHSQIDKYWDLNDRNERQMFANTFEEEYLSTIRNMCKP